jgi:hypothetical protein
VVPPLVGVAVNVAVDPSHIGLLPEVSAMDTEGTSTGLIVMVVPRLVTEVGLAHVAFEVRIQVIVCPLDNDEVLKVGLLVPAFTPFICHW